MEQIVVTLLTRNRRRRRRREMRDETMRQTKTMIALIGILFFWTSVPTSTCFTPSRTLCNIRSSQSQCLPLFEKVNELDATSTSSENETVSRQESSTTKNPLELASWYAVEAFGKVFGTKKSDGGVVESDQAITSIAINKPPSSLEETLKRIQLDNDRSYFFIWRSGWINLR